jgi:hypothetical protein
MERKLLFLVKQKSEWHLRKKWLQNVENLDVSWIGFVKVLKASNEAESTFTELR